jgi:hypothetical protein
MRSTENVTDNGRIYVRKQYLRFAEVETKGVSPLYEELARTVASDDILIDFISALPQIKQQPNLVFAAVRHLYGTPRNGQHFATLIVKEPEAIRQLILARSTQTNEPGRCATLLPVLCQLPQPLALLEVGASAGLCLLPDYYGYDYGLGRLTPNRPCLGKTPVFPCMVNTATPIPIRMPEIIWRQGLDLSPIVLAEQADRSWLETLVWPGQEARAARLRDAIDIARRVTPPVRQGDLLTDLQALTEGAPADATLIIFHSAVLGYLSSYADINRFVATIRQLRAIWISNELPIVLPDIAARAKQVPPKNRFVLAVDGEPVAFTGPHGQSIDWLTT